MPTGRQLMTVGHHFQHSRPLNNVERHHMDRSGVCLSCHQEIPSGSLAVSLLHHVALYSGKLPETSDQHNALLHKNLLLSGWAQILAGASVLAVAIFAVWRWRRRRRDYRRHRRQRW
jgi:hypothetical protein